MRHDPISALLHLPGNDRITGFIGLPEISFPYFEKKRPGLTRQAFIDSLSLRSIEPYLLSSAKFGVMTNENDFILTKGELEYLRQLFGERIKIYPRGGHLGNLEYKDNLAYMVNFLKEEVRP